MTANDIASKYTLARLSEMFAAAATEMQNVEILLHSDCISETMKQTTRAYKDTLTQYAQLVFDAIKIKEKL